MKIILYSFNDIHAEAFRLFLNKNNLPFQEITSDKPEFNDMKSSLHYNNISFLKIIKSHGIEIIHGFDEFILNQLIEHIKKYNPKIEV